MAALTNTANDNAAVPDRDKFEHGDEAATEPDFTEKGQIFEQWLLDNGAEFPDLIMKDYDHEVRGVHVTKDVPPDTDVMAIPLKCLITVEMGKATDVGQAILQSDLELDAPKHVFLMLFMLIDRKKPDSFFKPYYDILPATLSNMPIFWNDEELAELEGSYLLTQIDERNRAIEHDYNAICHLCPHFADIATLFDFKWARMCVCSRNFGIVVDNLRTSAMVPMADMLNHYRPRETKWAYENHRRAFTITTLQTITNGAQIYDSYGQKCNHRFLLNYGFSIENNCEGDGFCPNEVPFKFDLDPSDEFAEHKRQFWNRDNHSKLIRICVSDNENTMFGFACLRVMVATLEEFQNTILARRSGRMGATTVKDVRFPVSIRNEKAALLKLQQMVGELLGRYPSTLESDLERMQNGSLKPFSNQKHAVIQVVGEKTVLHHYREFCEVALDLIAVDPRDDEAYKIKYDEYQKQGVHRMTMNYCSPLGNGVIGQCRRFAKMELQTLAQQQEEDHDPTKPHTV